MSCKFICFSASILFCQVLSSFSIKIQHPSLWEKSHRTLLFTSDSNHRNNNWNYVASAQRTKAFKKSLIIQNIDGSILQFDLKNKTFTLTSEHSEKNLYNQMFVLTLNLQAIQLEHRNDSRIVQIIRRYIQEDKSNKKNFILIRSVYWPYYFCYNHQHITVYGSVIENNTLSHNCIWYRIITPSGYMKILKLNKMPFDNITYHDSKALTSYPKNHLTICPYSESLDKSFHWAVSLSHINIPRSRTQRSIFLTFPNQISSNIKWIFDRLKDLQQSIIPSVCLELDKQIHQEISYKNRLFHKINHVKQMFTKRYFNLSKNFDEYIDFLAIIYNYNNMLASYYRNLQFYQRHRLNNVNRTIAAIRKFERTFSSKIHLQQIIQFNICQTITEQSVCLCILPGKNNRTSNSGKCKTFQFNETIVQHFPAWSDLPSGRELFLAKIYQKRYQNSTSIIERRRAFFGVQFNKIRYYDKKFSRSQICL